MPKSPNASAAEKTAEAVVYHRLESRTQTPEHAAAQEKSGELWGFAMGCTSGFSVGGKPVVKAYYGPLPEGERGIEFTTSAVPDAGSPGIVTRKQGGVVYWTAGDRIGINDAGVENRGDAIAVIRISVKKNTQK